MDAVATAVACAAAPLTAAWAAASWK